MPDNQILDAQTAVSIAREILEDIGETCPAYVGFEKDSYLVTREQIIKIAQALYLADCELASNNPNM